MSVTWHHGTASALKAFWGKKADFREKDTDTTARSLLPMLNRSGSSGLGSCARTHRRETGESGGPSRPLPPFPGPAPQPPEGERCPEHPRSGSRAAPYPPHPPQAPSPAPHTSPLTAAPARAHLRWSKEWMLRAAFPCPPPTQLRERPNMLAANGCYGPRGSRASSSRGERRAKGRAAPRQADPGSGPGGGHRRTQAHARAEHAGK